MREHKIHIAFGFHVNCYHSYRGDSNDNLGFGSDIRIIRHIIDMLDQCNADGIPVKATWDSENFFSLEQILPQYAPDIIESMQRRVKENGDENIIMGYSNGALGAMNEDEFIASIQLAVSNQQGSGLKDIFGDCAMLVRPQEVMFTPSQVSLYNKMGIKALCLYYSCVPFDAFRTVVKRLPDEMAFNPLTYTYNGESMTILPTYNNSDICDAGCLRSWVKELRSKQENNEINTDLLLFVNMDADAIFWETMHLPLVGNRIANTDGINGLVREVADLDYVVFDTPGNYVDSHQPVGNIEFTQDTADGNFTGYASWAEKPYNRKIWTAIERARAMSKANADADVDSPSFMDRVKLLSTTHFGLATPVLNIQREIKANELADAIIQQERSALRKSEQLTIHNINGTTLQCVQLSVDASIDSATQLSLECDDLASYTIAPMDDTCSKVFAIMRFKQVKAQYTIGVSVSETANVVSETDLVLSTASTTVKFSVHGNIYSFAVNGRELGTNEFLKSFITYDGSQYDFNKLGVKPLAMAGNGRGIRVYGDIRLPQELTSGSFTYDFYTMDGEDMVFVRTTVQYPHTVEDTSISTENSSLGRFSDMKWSEAVPFQLTPTLDGDISVVKRNFMGDISTFRTQSFPECDAENSSLASFNHQLSAGVVGIGDENGGLLVANSRQVLGSMAHCPMRLDEDGTVHMNPFGTYYGPQRHHWGRSKDKILSTYTLVTPQGKSIAPAYNGNSETTMLALVGYTGAKASDAIMTDAIAFADGCVVSDNDSVLKPCYDDNVVIKEAVADGIQETKLRNPILSGLNGNIGKYINYGAKAISYIIAKQIKARK